MRGIRVLRLASLWRDLTPVQQTRLVSGGGRGAGEIWKVAPEMATLKLRNSVWRLSTMFRLAAFQDQQAARPHLCGLPDAAGATCRR
eukprot:2427744-Prorocentrum_lima.AAC.1